MSNRMTVTVGDEQIVLEPFSGRKAMRVIRTIERITKGVPQILDAWADFTREYEARNVTEMDRATARYYYKPDVLMVAEPVLSDGKPVFDADGDVLYRQGPKLDENGDAVLGPDPLGHMTEEDWAASGNKLRIPRSPSQEERIAAIFPKALELAEYEVTMLLAVLATSNADLKRKAREGSLKEFLEERAEDLMDAPMTDLLELAVVAGEMVDDQISSKMKTLGNRLPNALRLFGLNPPKSQTETTSTSSTESSETKPISSTDSPPPTDGASVESSTELAGTSSTS